MYSENIRRFLQANAPANFLIVGDRALTGADSGVFSVYTPFKELHHLRLGDVFLTHYHFTDGKYLTLIDEEYHIYMPSRERAIIDAIAWLRESYDEGELIRAIQKYIDYHKRDLSKLYEVADHYGVERDLVDYWVKEAEEECDL